MTIQNQLGLSIPRSSCLPFQFYMPVQQNEFFLLFKIISADRCYTINLIQPAQTSFLSHPTLLPLKFVCLGTKLCAYVRKKKQSDVLFPLQEVFGYETQNLRRVLCLLISVLTCGVLLLVFYWKPQWRVWATCIPCPLQEADTILLRTTVRVLLCCICGTASDWPGFLY